MVNRLFKNCCDPVTIFGIKRNLNIPKVFWKNTNQNVARRSYTKSDPKWSVAV